VRDVADVACDPRNRRRHADNARTFAAQRRKVLRQRAPITAAELRFAMVRSGKLAQARDRDARVVDVQDGDAAGGVRWHAMHRQLRQGAKPARAEAAFAVEQRRPHDGVIGAARADRRLAA